MTGLEVTGLATHLQMTSVRPCDDLCEGYIGCRAKVWKQPRCPSVQTRHPNCGAAACRECMMAGNGKLSVDLGEPSEMQAVKEKGKGRKERKKRNGEKREEGREKRCKLRIFICTLMSE